MKVSDLMHEDVKTCTVNDWLNVAARLMWENDCGCVPVLDETSGVVGMVTDRDICMAAYFQNRPLTEIRIAEAMSKQLFSCGSADAVETAEKTMRENQIRRLPVIDDDGRVLGILSLNDIALEAERERRVKGRKQVKVEEVAATLAAVCEPNRAAAASSVE